MTTTYPAPSTTTRPITFAVGTMVRIQHNEGLYKIHSHAAWSADDHRTPTYYNITGPSGQLHKMVPVERLILRADTMGAARYADREILGLDAILGNLVPRVKHTHCWRCASELDSLVTKACPKCEGLKCKCGGCRCNWPYASPSTPPGNFIFYPHIPLIDKMLWRTRPQPGFFKGGALPPGAHAKGMRKTSPREDRPDHPWHPAFSTL